MILRRMSITKPSGRQLTEAEEASQPHYTPKETNALRTASFGFETLPNQTIAMSSRPPSWRSMRPDRLAETDPTHPLFTRVNLDSPMFTLDATMDAALDTCAGAAATLEANTPSDPVELGIHTAEMDIWRKITVQKGRIKGWFLTKLDPPPFTVPQTWIDCCRIITSHMLGQPPTLSIPPAPLDTNAGFPAFTGGLPAKLLSHILGHGSSWRTIDEQSALFLSRINIPVAASQAFAISSRQGPLNKEAPYYDTDGGGIWTPRFMARGSWSRTRQVFMGSFGLNVALEPLLARLQGGRRGTRGFWHDKTSDREVTRRAWAQRLHIIEADISGYDQSVSPSLQQALADAISTVDPSLHDQAQLYLYAERRSVITQPWAGETGAMVVTTRGATHSGQRLTAEVGSMICATTTLFVLTQLLKRPAPWIWERFMTGEWMMLIQGDDILLGLPTKLDDEAWAATWMQVGLKCHLLEGFRFLMKHRLADGDIPVAGRIVQQTLFNEHEPSGTHWDPILVLGMQARWGAGPPLAYAAMARKCLQTTEFYQRTHVFDGPSAVEWLNVPENQRALQAKIARLASQPWLRKLRNDAEYSESARLQYEALLASGLVPTDDEDRALAIALQMMISRTAHIRTVEQRVGIALRVWDVIQAGGPVDSQILRLQTALVP